MAVDKKEVAMWVAGVLASAAVAFLIYRLERNSAAQNAAAAANAEADQQSALANQQAEVASLPSVSVPTISSQPSTASPTDTTNQASAPANESALYALLGSLMGADNSPVTSQSNPVGSITELPLPTSASIPAVTIPAVNNFASAASNNSLPTGMGTFSGAANSTVVEPSGLTLNTNVAKGRSLAVNPVS